MCNRDIAALIRRYQHGAPIDEPATVTILSCQFVARDYYRWAGRATIGMNLFPVQAITETPAPPAYWSRDVLA